ncbi:carbohydrate kinase family protein [Kitasatospora sp. NPDC052896]|uniref:carbohydrate kinase family protein n=1 Tax=Kitasatospora sp. NPDC052896 TaxID=3364061 RepID=UPI0037CB23B9
MRIAVTGSIATDHLMSFPGKFSEHILLDQVDRISLSFLVDGLEVRRGGVAANIAFGLGSLGLTPYLVGAAGHDFTDYGEWLRRHGVDTESVRISASKHTARFVCTTDEAQNQLASFYTGAMAEAREIELTPVAERVGGVGMVVIGPNDPEAMLRHTDECRAMGFPFLADPSQQLARADREMARSLVDGATYLFTNEYEAALLTQKSGWTPREVLERVGHWVITRGAEGSTIEHRDRPPVAVPAVTARAIADPTGVGDAFRAGYLAGLSWGLDERGCAQLGSVLATLALEVVGTQEYRLDPADLLERLRGSYGDEAAAPIARRLPAAV